MILNLLIGLIASSAIQTAFARTWFLSEIDLRKRAQVISKIRFERTKLLIGIDPESCKKEESVDRKEQLVMKQLEEVRKRGHLSHCSHLKFPGQEALESSLAQTPMPGRINLPETSIPMTKPIGALAPQNPGQPSVPGAGSPSAPDSSRLSQSGRGTANCDHEKNAEIAARTGRLPDGDCIAAGSYPYMKGSENIGTGENADKYIAVAQTAEELTLTYLKRGVPLILRNGGQSAKSGGIDNNFQPRSLTHFNGHEMKSEGMHALRLFYSGEKPETQAYLNPRECRIIISGDVEFTAALHADTPTHPCMSICQKTLRKIVEEKKPKGFFMSCHLFGETIGTDSRGDISTQGLDIKKNESFKCLAKEGVEGRGWNESTKSYVISETQTVLDKEVSSKAECYREFVDYYYDRAKKVPLNGKSEPDEPDVLVLYSQVAQKKEKLGQFILRKPMEEKIPNTNECQFDAKVLHTNYIHSEDLPNFQVVIGHYLTWVAKELKGKSCKESCDQVNKERGPLSGKMVSKDMYADWSFTCADKNGIYKKCTMKGGCK